MYFNEKEPSMVWKEEDLIELTKSKKRHFKVQFLNG